jgi:hypothetical protein
MILEGIVTTTSAAGTVHIAPMGPQMAAQGGDWSRLLLRPFQTAQTYQNLEARPEGVFHVTDDVLLLARAALGEFDFVPACRPAEQVKGWVLNDCCRYYEFRVQRHDRSQARAELEAVIVHAGRQRDFFGFNRAKHAVVEAAILATRLHLLPREQVRTEMERLRILVDKTGAEQEHQAFALITRRVDQAREDP